MSEVVARNSNSKKQTEGGGITGFREQNCLPNGSHLDVWFAGRADKLKFSAEMPHSRGTEIQAGVLFYRTGRGTSIGHLPSAAALCYMLSQTAR